MPNAIGLTVQFPSVCPPDRYTLKANSITLASSELAPNMFGASSEPASVMEFRTN